MWLLNQITRDRIFVVLGATGFLHELLIANAERPFILTASLALMGFPLVLKTEEKLKKNGVIPQDGEK
jgi:hypothetical protein